jgi:hypothetical protein
MKRANQFIYFWKKKMGTPNWASIKKCVLLEIYSRTLKKRGEGKKRKATN